MATTQAFRNALHIPYADPETGESVVTLSAGDLYTTAWAEAGGGGAFPSQTGPFQLLVTDSVAPYLWEVVDTLDCGEYG